MSAFVTKNNNKEKIQPIYQMYSQLEQRQQESQPLTAHDAALIRKTLHIVRQKEQQRIQEGFNEINFSMGVINTMFLSWMFGHYPQHFWVVYLIEVSVLLPTKMWQDYHHRPMNQILYYLDYCWIMTFIMVIGLFFLSMGPKFFGDEIVINDAVQQNMYLAVVGIGCGPLLGATAILPFVAFVFHDNQAMTSLFVHLTPPMLVYCFIWHADEIKESWPNTFNLDVVGHAQFWPDTYNIFIPPWKQVGSIVGNAMLVYLLWFIPYTIWMLGWGIELPRTHRSETGQIIRKGKYDTVFASLLRSGSAKWFGTTFWGRPVDVSEQQMTDNAFERRDVIAYMAIHIVLCTAATVVVSLFCTHDKIVHGAFLCALTIICVFRGAQRYVYWTTGMSSKALQREYKEILQDIKLT